MGQNKKAPQDKRLEALAVKTEEQKKALVSQLRRTPIVQIACEKVGVGRSTYYKWRAEDRVFARAADKALEAGRFFINDMAESKLIKLIQNENITAIIYWLKHNQPRYSVRVIHEHDAVCLGQSTEEKHIELRKMGLYGMTPQHVSEAEIRDFFEAEEAADIQQEEIAKSIEAYDEK